LPEVPLSVVVATLAVIAAVAIYWFGTQANATLGEIWASQQVTTVEIEAINDRLDAERRDLSDQFSSQTSGKNAINDSLAAERDDLKRLTDQFKELAARLTALQDAMTRIPRDNAEIAERLKETQAQMAQDNGSVAEQLNALTQMVRDNASAAEQLEENHEQTTVALAKDTEESLRSPIPLPRPHPTAAVPKRRKHMRL
jgi:septal ring factor EnvC (AmiA/AmiB activator)